MLEITDFLFEIIACLAAAALCLAIYLQRVEQLRLRGLIRCERADREALENEVAALLACSKNIGERVTSQVAKQNSMLKKLDVIDLYRDSSESSSYDKVRKMMEQGFDLEEIANICDLRRGEMELLSQFTSQRTAA